MCRQQNERAVELCKAVLREYNTVAITGPMASGKEWVASRLMPMATIVRGDGSKDGEQLAEFVANGIPKDRPVVVESIMVPSAIKHGLKVDALIVLPPCGKVGLRDGLQWRKEEKILQDCFGTGMMNLVEYHRL